MMGLTVADVQKVSTQWYDFRLELTLTQGGAILNYKNTVPHRGTNNDLAEICYAAQGTKRPAHIDRAGHDGRELVQALLDSRSAGRRTAGKRMPACSGQAPVGTTSRFPRHQRALRLDRRVLRSPRRFALVRTQ